MVAREPGESEADYEQSESVPPEKKNRSKGFRLRSAQSRQYRNLRAQLRLAEKKGAKVDRDLRKQVRHLAANQLRKETGAKGTVAAALIKELWEQDEACSSCHDRKRKLEPGVKAFLEKKAEAKKKAKAAPAV
eukprot:s4053_g12.t1